MWVTKGHEHICPHCPTQLSIWAGVYIYVRINNHCNDITSFQFPILVVNSI